MAQEDRLRQQIEALQEQWELLSTQISQLGLDKVAETRADERLRLDRRMTQLKEDREQIEKQLTDLETQLETDLQRGVEPLQQPATPVPSRPVRKPPLQVSPPVPHVTESSMPGEQVFICYAHEDEAVATRLYDDLKQAGAHPWISCKCIKPGQRWKATIKRAMKESTFILALLSNQSVSKAGYVQKELKEALNMLDQMPSSAIFLIPVRIEDYQPEDEQLEEIHWVDLFPEAQYAAGLALLLDVLIPDRLQSPEPKPANEPPPQPPAASPVIHLRSEPLPVSKDEYKKVFRLDKKRRPLEYIQNDFEDQGDVVVDRVTGLMWQKAGSGRMSYKDAPAYIDTLNREQFAGHNDWRLPTIPELMSLLEPGESSNGLYIDSIFDETQFWCWSANRQSEGGSSSVAWYVYFYIGYVSWGTPGNKYYVRAVRS